MTSQVTSRGQLSPCPVLGARQCCVPLPVPRRCRVPPPRSPGSILQQPGEVTGAIPQLCVTHSNNTLCSLSSQGLQGGPLQGEGVPASSLIINTRRQLGTWQGLGVLDGGTGTLGGEQSHDSPGARQ